MISKSYRLKEFFNPNDQRSLILDASAGLSLGTIPGLENFRESVEPLLTLVDGIITSPGQSRVFAGRTREDAALLLRGDWTNALRNEDFVLPPESIYHVSLLESMDALDLGASAMVLYFLLGHAEDIEADCLKKAVQLSIQGGKTGLPLILDVQPIGDRVVLRSKAIELGVSYALEAGADGAAVPWPGEESFKAIIKMSAEMPIWIKPAKFPVNQSRILQALELGASGIWLNEAIFSQDDVLNSLHSVMQIVHPELIIQVQG